MLKEADFYNSREENDLVRFKLEADVIISNRSASALVDLESKVYASDLYGVD